MNARSEVVAIVPMSRTVFCCVKCVAQRRQRGAMHCKSLTCSPCETCGISLIGMRKMRCASGVSMAQRICNAAPPH